MEKVRPWCDQPLVRGRLKISTELITSVLADNYYQCSAVYSKCFIVKCEMFSFVQQVYVFMPLDGEWFLQVFVGRLISGAMYFWGQNKNTGDPSMYPKPIHDLSGWNIRSIGCWYDSFFYLLSLTASLVWFCNKLHENHCTNWLASKGFFL